ncbi:MAG: 4-hydroxythreonine-4-phosphate dehydrogenase PdxA [Gammaproteobacteria bacterium]|nr:MAG: 4-hydroxythreonine-4-phosphate dehydrogenase PdxA [Gammaproteobacteria bacterium]
MSPLIPRLLITPGDPAGIGPELCIQIAQSSFAAELIFIADPELLRFYANKLSIDVKLEDWTPSNRTRSHHQAGRLKVYSTKLRDKITPGELSLENAHYVVETLDKASDLLLNDQADALVTGPVHKAIINQAGIAFSGHTEYLAEKSSTEQVVMMLSCADFRVALVTTHLPLKEVSDAITEQRLTRVLKVLEQDMRQKFHLETPVIHVCGLNPHAGEDGILGNEEIETITPVLEKLRKQGFSLKGPIPADTALTPKGLEGADVTLAMYHDQGLSVLKYAGFGKAVNITLGLPYIRVSVDHGTALDLAGKGTANCGSLREALNQAIFMARNDK